MLKVYYTFGCPNCGGPIDDEHLLAGVPCSKCVPGRVENLDYRVIYDLLVKNSTLKGYAEYFYDNESFEEIVRIFKRVIGNEPWNLQKYWIKRLAKSESFSLSAPTGLGKTTTLLVYSLFFNNTTLYVVPTNSLKDQICERLRNMGAHVSCNDIKEEYINVATFNRILRHYDNYVSLQPKLVIVDDSDMILKSGKTTEVMAKILGISEEIFQHAISLIRLKRTLKFNEDDKELKNKIVELEYKIGSWKPFVQFLVASATLRPKGIKQQALRTLIGFEPSTIQTYLRNIADLYYQGVNIEEILDKISDSGGLLLVSKEYGREKMLELKEIIEKRGYSAGLAISGRKFLDKFSEGKIDYLIGSASYYGVAVRGLDEPKRLKYVIFYGIPKIRMNLADALNNPSLIVKIGELLNIDVKDIRRKLLFLSPPEFQILRYSLMKGEELSGKLKDIKTNLVKIKEKIWDILRSDNIKKLKADTFLVAENNSKYYLYIPDTVTYIQASGRSSRIINNGLTFGISIVLVDSDDLLDILFQKLKKIIPNFTFKSINEVDMRELKSLAISSREVSISQKKKINIKTILLVVESPTKAKTIARLFGRPSRREVHGIPVYETIILVNDEILIANIIATKGHITDLTTENIGYYGVEVGNNEFNAYYSPIYKCYNCGKTFTIRSNTCPYCGSAFISSSEKVISALRKLSTEVDEIYIASDPDQEGEKIAYDVAMLISPYNKNIYRIKYHEVTRNGILNAILNKGRINMNLVRSQIVRRIEDRWIGFELSSALKSMFYDKNHGSGRVQGPVLSWIAQRTKEYKTNYGWILYIKLGDYTVKKFFRTKEEANKFIENLNIKVNLISEREEIQNPLPPFTTDSLLMDAYDKLGISSQIVMKIAQELFESGLITYHRTDSTHVSALGISIAKEYLESKNLNDSFSGRSWGNEGTHEAIRPTSSMDTESLIKDIEDNPNKYFIKFNKYHLRVYDLIFRRFIASQMKPATVTYSKFEIFINDEKFEVELPTKVSGGFSIIYPLKTYIVTEKYSTYLNKGSIIPLFTYAEVIKNMKEKEIGRPSTYAKTISALIRHGYVVESKRKALLIATNKGIKAYEFLSSCCSDLISENRTKLLLQKIDKIANGDANVDDVLEDLHKEITQISGKLINSLKLDANI
ncbi:reverse gyrase [Sulfolobus sp. S-194]|uniref:reverse gyrase n=1 Tax=Sulfolobus sp. S-194 TaxID=2512240 RepID=UPI001436CF30|nr:reverse gyrase [Sulfolobus sp. S-194]QIW24204.1 reverse gyrase [Sulfolobus sp. S-194]